MNKEKILDKLNEGEQYLDEIKMVTDLSLEELKGDFYKLRTAERLFEILSQVMIDSCNQVISKLNTQTPTNYAHCFELLADKGIIPDDTAVIYGNIAKMRNIVAHQYTKIDIELLFDGLKRLKIDFPQFKKKILNWIEN